MTMNKIAKCSVCKRLLSNSEVEKFNKAHEGLYANWGMCEGKEASIIYEEVEATK